MQNLYLCSIISLIFLSCSPNDLDTTKSVLTEIGQKKVSYTETSRPPGLYPENASNAYDVTGQLYYDISSSFMENNMGRSSMTEIVKNVDLIANYNNDFILIRPIDYVSSTPAQLNIYNNDAIQMKEIILNSALAQIAKDNLIVFLEKVMLYKDQQVSYDTIYHFIVDYEAGLNSDSTLTAADKKRMLTTTSITRYAFYFASERKRSPRDRDWETMWGDIVAGFSGSYESNAKAIIMSINCGIYSNRLY